MLFVSWLELADFGNHPKMSWNVPWLRDGTYENTWGWWNEPALLDEYLNAIWYPELCSIKSRFKMWAGFLCQETCRVEKLNVNVVFCVFEKLTIIFICVTEIIKSFRNCNNYTERAWAHAVWSTISYCWSFLDIYNCKNVKDHNKRSNLNLSFLYSSNYLPKGFFL